MDTVQLPVVGQTVSPTAPLLAQPLDRAEERVTKKPFGIKISPHDSPVQPERFSGYHTGVDFEIFPDEANTDVAVSAVCEGKILQRRTASGYGGIVVQACTIQGQAVTVVYGHLKIASVGQKVGDTLKIGQQFAILGTGYSSETSGERKHLHLGIHKGSSPNVAGYVQSKAALDGWFDFEALLKAV